MTTRQQLWKEVKDILSNPRDRKLMNIKYGSRSYLAELLENLKRVQSIIDPIIVDAEEIPQTPQTPQTVETPQIPQTPQTPQTVETPQIPQTPQTVEIPQSKRISIKIDDINGMFNFKKQHYHRNEETIITHTSLKGGKYLISSNDHSEFFQYLSLSYSKYFVNKVGEEIWSREYLSEIVPDKCAYNKFKFFLDLETKDEDFSISLEVIDKITKTLNDYIQQNTSYTKYVDPVVAVNNKFQNQKVHLIYPSICVDKSTYKEILHNLTVSLDNHKIANCIDCGVSGLRLLGCSKPGEDDIESDSKGQYVPIKNYSGQIGGFSVLKSNGKSRIFYPFRNNVNPENIKLFSIRDTTGCDILTLNNRTPVRVFNNDFFHRFELPCEDDIIDQTTYLIDGLGDYRSRERKYWYSIGVIIYHLSEGTEWGFDLYHKFSNRSSKHSCISEDMRRKEFENFGNKDTHSRLGYWNILVNCYKKDTCHIPSFVIEREISDKSSIFTRIYEEDWDIYKSGIQIIQKGTYCQFVEKNIFEDSKSKTVLVKASLGNGKTTAIKQYLLENPHLSVVWISPRISFTQSFMCDKDFVSKSGFEDYISVQNESIVSKRVIIQYESLNRLKRDYDVIVCDEIESVLIQMISKETNQRNIDYNFEILSNLLKNASKVILADAYLSKRCLTLVKCLGLDNTRIFSYDRPRSHRMSYSYDNLGDTLNHLIDNIQKGKRSYLFCTSKKKLLETIIPTLRKYVPEFDNVSIVYTSSYHKNVNPGDWSNKLFIATTSKITVGVDCQILFDDIFCIAYKSSGVLARDICQSLYRVRNITGNCYFYIDEKQNNIRNDKTPFSLSHSHLHFNNLKCLNKSILSSEWSVKWGASPFETMFVISKTEYSFNNTFFKEILVKYLEVSGYKFVDFTLKQTYDNIVYQHTDDIDFFKINLCNYGLVQHKLDNNIKLTDEEVLKLYKQKFLNTVDFKTLLDEFQDKPLFEQEVNDIFKKFMSGSLGLNLLKKCKQSLEKLMEYQHSRYGSALGNDLIYHKIYSHLTVLFDDYNETEEIGFDFFETDNWKCAYNLLKTVKRLTPRKKSSQRKYNATPYQEDRKALNMFLKSIGYKVLLGKRSDRDQKRQGFTINYLHQICGVDFINYVKL